MAVLTPEELNNMFFLPKDIWSRTAWHMSSENDKLDICRNLWELAEEVLTQEELNNVFLTKGRTESTAKDGGERTACTWQQRMTN